MSSFDWPTYLQSFAGGGLIGLAAALYLLLNGRIAGVSGMVHGSLVGFDENRIRNIAFLLGLTLGPVVYYLGFGAWPEVRIEATHGILAFAGLFVGFGARLGSGCTSGHGVCGLARFSRRSFAAVLIFFGTAVLTVYLMKFVDLSS
jgi:uncharacterized membrane protein YedE/YeeE